MKQVLRVTDMHCPNCAMTIESLEDELPGVKSISASYRNGKVDVEYDESRLSLEKIITAIREKGYTAQTS
jgi:copper chaperone